MATSKTSTARKAAPPAADPAPAAKKLAYTRNANPNFKKKPVPRTKNEARRAERGVAKLPDHMRLEKRTNLGLVRVADVASVVNPEMELTDKAKLFIRYWAQGESKYAAAVRAGYEDSGAYCYRISRSPQAIALYEQEKRLYEEAAQMSRKKVMDGLLEGIEMAKLAGEPASVITGWKTIGQMCGYFEPRKVSVDVNVQGNLTMQQMNKMSDADLLRVIQQGVQNDLQQLEHDGDGD